MKKTGFLLFVFGFTEVFASEVIPLGAMDGFYRNTAVLDRTLDQASLMWEIPEWMTKTDFPYKKKPFQKELPFTDGITVVRLLGGWMDNKLDPHRDNDPNDLAGRAADGNIFYRWDLLKARLDPYVAQGYELTLVLDNMPHCLPKKGEADSGKHFGQVTPPKDIQEWYAFVRSMCEEIRRLYGMDIESRLRFRMGTEMQDERRFNGTFEQYCQVYDHASKAVKEIFPKAKFGPFNRAMPHAHTTEFNGLVAGPVSYLKLADHCANGTNTATGEIGSPFDFAPRSFYYFSSLDENGGFVNIQPDQRLPEFRRMWEAIEAVSPKYKGISREVQEYGPHLNTEGGIYGLDTGVRGAAQNLDTLIGMKEIGADRVWHWELFEKVASDKTLMMSQAWLYCFMERMHGGQLFSLPVKTETNTGNRVRAWISVNEKEAILMVSHWNVDRILHVADKLTVSLPKNINDAAVVGMLQLTEQNSVYDVLRNDLKNSGLLAQEHLKHRGAPVTTLLTPGYTEMAADRSAAIDFVGGQWERYQALMEDSLKLQPFCGAVDDEKITFLAACPSVSVFVFRLNGGD